MNKLLRAKALMVAALLFTQVFLTISVKAQETNGVLQGTIRGENSQPLPNVSVGVHNSRTKFASGTKTDSSGVFTLRLPAGGPYEFTFSSVGFEPQTLSGYNVKANGTISLDLSMKT